ncbi:MAG: hypothetical protein PHP08_00245 [Candidatus Dojkabacteria bacterium]|nr:hypothetical protein [Candidatus Dojkabacteria bacterium]
MAVLTSSAVFGAWSAWNSSLFTASTFVDDEPKYKNAKLAMDLGLATAIATGAGVYLVYHEKGKSAAIAAVATGVALYAAYYLKLRCNPNVAPYMMGGNGKKPEKLDSINKMDSTYNIDISTWKPLSEQEINKIRNITTYKSFEFVSEK